MSRRLDQILVVDLECSCWEDAPAHCQASEIIEIGLCVVDVARLERLERASLLVKPVSSEISPFCTRLTSLTAADLAEAGSLAEACAVLRKRYRSQDRQWASWGDYDRRQLEKACAELGVRYPFGPGHLNVRTLFAMAHGLAAAPTMEAALSLAGLPLEGSHHRGVDDAWNIAALLCGLLGAARGRHPVALS